MKITFKVLPVSYYVINTEEKLLNKSKHARIFDISSVILKQKGKCGMQIFNIYLIEM